MFAYWLFYLIFRRLLKGESVLYFQPKLLISEIIVNKEIIKNVIVKWIVIVIMLFFIFYKKVVFFIVDMTFHMLKLD